MPMQAHGPQWKTLPLALGRFAGVHPCPTQSPHFGDKYGATCENLGTLRFITRTVQRYSHRRSKYASRRIAEGADGSQWLCTEWILFDAEPFRGRNLLDAGMGRSSRRHGARLYRI